MGPDSLELAKLGASLPLTVLLLLVLIGGFKGWWIYGSVHLAELEDLRRQVANETARAARWEARYLEAAGRPSAPPSDGTR